MPITRSQAVGRALLVALAIGPEVALAIGGAQQPTSAVPQLSPDAALRLQVLTLRGENIALKMSALQAEFAALQAEARTYTDTLRRDGYVLQRAADGAWSYVPAPARPAQEPKP